MKKERSILKRLVAGFGILLTIYSIWFVIVNFMFDFLTKSSTIRVSTMGEDILYMLGTIWILFSLTWTLFLITKK